MAAKDRKELQIEFLEVDISGRISDNESRHIVTTELIWPRLQVASKAAVKTLTFKKGMCNCAALPWSRRILFKEGVEHHFGIALKVTESLTETAINSFLRNCVASIFKLGEKAADDVLVSPLDDVAAIPLTAGRKMISKAAEAEIILDGCADFNAEDIVDGMEWNIPLTAAKDKIELLDGLGPHGNGKRRKILFHKGDVLGKARLKVELIN